MRTFSEDYAGKSDLVDIQCQQYLGTRGKTHVFNFENITGDDGRVYLPTSLIDFDHESGVISMPRWLAKEKGLVEK